MLKSCCCGIPLQKGTIIIGILSAIGTAISCLIWTIALILVVVDVDAIDVNSAALTTAYIIFLVNCSFGILVSTGQFIMAIILVLGANQEDPRKVRLYLIYGTIFMILSLISTLLSAGIIAILLSVFLVYALQTFFLYVIWSYYKELKAKGENAGGVIFVPPPQQAVYGPTPSGYVVQLPQGYAPARSPGYVMQLPQGYAPAPPLGYAHSPPPGYPPSPPVYEQSSSEPKRDIDFHKV